MAYFMGCNYFSVSRKIELTFAEKCELWVFKLIKLAMRLKVFCIDVDGKQVDMWRWRALSTTSIQSA